MFSVVGERSVVFTKLGMMALLQLASDQGSGLVYRVDPREEEPAWRSYPTMGEAAYWFERSVAGSLRNGWAIIYDGPGCGDWTVPEVLADAAQGGMLVHDSDLRASVVLGPPREG